MRTGRTFRRCNSCGAPMPKIDGKRQRRCPKHPSGNTSWAYSIDVQPKGAPRERKLVSGFTSEADAKAALDVVRERLRTHGEYREPSKLTLGEYALSWHEGRRHDVKTSTWTMQGTQVRKHLSGGALGAVPLRSLTSPMIRQWETDLIDGGLSGKTVANLHGLLGVALRDAVDDGMLIVSPMPSRRPKVSRPQLTQLEPTDVGTFLRAVSDDPQPWVTVYYLTVAATAMRRSEALGLKWSDFTETGDGFIVTVERTLASVVDGQPVFASTKTDRVRQVGIPAAVMEKLMAYRKAQVRSVSGLVFTHGDSSPIRPELATRTFRRLWDGVPELPRGARLHDLRHAWVTARLSMGEVSTKELADVLGHSDGRMIEQVYGHVLSSTRTASAEAVASAIGI